MPDPRPTNQPRPLLVRPPTQPNPDDLIDEYAEKLQRIYDHETAGDYTFVGLLAEFTRKLLS